MRVFLYEFATGGGFWHLSDGQPAGSLLAEGRAMIQAVAADFAACDGVEVTTTLDARIPAFHLSNCRVITVRNAGDELLAIERLCTEADWTLLIAPETAGVLLERCRLVESAGGRLLSPSSEVVGIAANKQVTAERLAGCRVPVPRGQLIQLESLDLPVTLSYPVVVKPVDGCGSQDIRIVRDAAERRAIVDSALTTQHGTFRCEEFTPGLPGSVAVLCGPAGNHALRACEQRLSSNGRFSYVGGRLPLSPQLDDRARRLGLAAVAALPQTLGYVGVDLVLGEADDGSDDRVIEVNPRLTTSYVGLRAASRTNLAAAMLAVAAGESCDLRFGVEPVEFTADGTIFA